MKTSPKKFIINPCYWPLWLFYGVVRVLVLLPFRIQCVLGKYLGGLIRLFPSKSKRTAQTNIDLCFPAFSRAERVALLKKHYESVGIFVFEVAMAFWGSDRRLKKIPFEVSGVEHYEAAIAKGTGILATGPHFMSLELCGRLLSMRYPFAAMYRRSKIPFVEHLLRPALDRHYADVVERQELRKLFAVLKRNLMIWYAADVDMGKDKSVFAPFMGVMTATMTAPSRLAQKTGATVVPIVFYREGHGYCLDFMSMPEQYPTGDPLVDAELLNANLTQSVSAHPDQYMWQYKRFKTRPPGEARFYKR